MTNDAAVDPRIRGHMPALDGVRGLAILMVLVVHFIGDAEPTTRFEKLLVAAGGQGVYGVDLFFVLSGFLITGILVDARTGSHYFRNFYLRRAVRIFPLYYAVLAVVFFAGGLLPFISSSELATLRAHQAWAWLYGTNIYDAKEGALSFPYLDHLWSLAVEEHFYFVWPAVVFFVTPRALVRTSAAIVAAAFLAHVVCRLADVNPVAQFVLTPLRLDALVLGGFLSVLARRPGGMAAIERWVKPAAVAAVVVLVGTYAFNQVYAGGYAVLRPLRNMLIIGLLAALLVGALTTGASTLMGRVFRAGWMRFLGKYSYGLYVFHHFISYWFVTHDADCGLFAWVGSHTLAILVRAVVGSVVSIGIAYASFHLFEKRALALKRLWPSGSASS